MRELNTIDDLHAVVKRLTGNIKPVGDSGNDAVRYDNLVNTIELIELLLNDVITVAAYKHSMEHSVSRAGIEADKFITHLREKLNP